MPLKKARAKKLFEIWNQHKILRFFDTHNDIFKIKFFWVIIALFAYFKCKCEKNCTFSNILQKVKSNFFANIYHSPCDSYWNSKKSIKLKPPSIHTQAAIKVKYCTWEIFPWVTKCKRGWSEKIVVPWYDTWHAYIEITNLLVVWSVRSTSVFGKTNLKKV